MRDSRTNKMTSGRHQHHLSLFVPLLVMATVSWAPAASSLSREVESAASAGDAAQSDGAPANSTSPGGDSVYSLRCWEFAHLAPALELTGQIDELSSECRILKFFNQTQLDSMAARDSLLLARLCACQLGAMSASWLRAYVSSFTSQLAAKVRRELALEHAEAERTHAEHHANRHFSSAPSSPVEAGGADSSRRRDYEKAALLWTDADVTVYGISIYTANRDFFEKRDSKDPAFRMSARLREQMDDEPIWESVKRFCRVLDKDRLGLYQYLENLVRLDSLVFLELVNETPTIETVYQASKACKMLLIEHFAHYRLRPERADLVVASNFVQNLTYAELMAATASVSDAAQQPPGDSINSILPQYLDRSPLRCANKTKLGQQQLAAECPMMLEERISPHWAYHYRLPLARSKLAIKCGCQLLLHNGTWNVLMQDENVRIMSKILIKHLNNNLITNFHQRPIWVLYRWFEDQMQTFTKHRSYLMKQIIKYNQQNPFAYLADELLKPINHLDREQALEISRKACNLIMFNYDRSSRFKNELKFIKYLDRLQLLSQDPMFVFHLTLMEPNLFKLHALSKMCRPIIR